MNTATGTASSHLQLTAHLHHAQGYAGEIVWPVIAALWDEHQLIGHWNMGVIEVECCGYRLYVQEFGQVLAIGDDQWEVAA